jgi:predicted transcriptional regulator
VDTNTIKRTTSVRLRKDLVSRIKNLAKSENRSVSNFIETALVKVIDFETPNGETIEAMKEVEAEMANKRKSLKRYTDVESIFQDLET